MNKSRRLRKGHRGQRGEPGRWFRPPEKDFYKIPDLVLRGGHVATDGCRRVLDFTSEKICLDLGDSLVTFYGQNLHIESFSGRRLVCSGLVRSIEFRRKWEAEG